MPNEREQRAELEAAQQKLKTLPLEPVVDENAAAALEVLIARSAELTQQVTLQRSVVNEAKAEADSLERAIEVNEARHIATPRTLVIGFVAGFGTFGVAFLLRNHLKFEWLPEVLRPFVAAIAPFFLALIAMTRLSTPTKLASRAHREPAGNSTEFYVLLDLIWVAFCFIMTGIFLLR